MSSTSGVEAAAREALAGALIVLPTDTVYGIAARPDSQDAMERLFEAKGRSHEVAVAVLAATPLEARDVASHDERATRLARRAWPGPVTLVLPRTPRSAEWSLGGDPATIGVRVPNHPVAMDLLSRTGPLAVSSANRSGDETPATCEALRAVFADRVAAYLCDAGELRSRPSAVLDLTRDEPVVLRDGALERADIERLLSD
jgi:tRNA threonylcarbamoyl adenosine modification protein (Sua5/YciO/YrdC/YwlC family)